MIILSSSAEPNDIAAAYRLGANAYLAKPSEASKPEEMVRALNDFWLLHNTPPSCSRVERGAPSLANFRDRAFDSQEPSSMTGSRGRARV